MYFSDYDTLDIERLTSIAKKGKQISVRYDQRGTNSAIAILRAAADAAGWNEYNISWTWKRNFVVAYKTA